jgi:hypothetical protein
MKENHPEILLKLRRQIDNVVKPAKRYRTRPGNEVGL